MDELPGNVAAAPLATPVPALPAMPGPGSPAQFARRKTVARPPAQPAVGPFPRAATPAPARPDERERVCKRAVRGLSKRAGGFVSQEVKSTYDVDAQGNRQLKSQVVTRKQNPPDLAAIIFALTNLEGGQWQAKPGENAAQAAGEGEGEESPGRGAGPDLSAIPDEVLRSVLKYFPAEKQDLG